MRPTPARAPGSANPPVRFEHGALTRIHRELLLLSRGYLPDSSIGSTRRRLKQLTLVHLSRISHALETPITHRRRGPREEAE